MAKNLRAVGLEFLASAPNRTVTQVRLAQPIEVVFGAIAEHPEHWGSWYPGFGAGGYTSPAPHGVGSVREMKVGGLLTIETMLAWDAPSRWAFYISKATMPGIRAFAEDYALAPDGADGTLLTWTLAVELAPAAKPLGPLLGKAGPKLTRRAFAKLDRRLATIPST
jgi:carbon monoxide dehydrogenase subunit G